MFRGQQLRAAELRVVGGLLGRREVGGEGGAEVRELGGAAGGGRRGEEGVGGGVVGRVEGLVVMGRRSSLQERAPLGERHVVVFERVGGGGVDGEGGGVGGRGGEAGGWDRGREVLVAEHGAALAEEGGGCRRGGDVAGGEAGLDAFLDGGRDDRAGAAAQVAGLERRERGRSGREVALMRGVSRQGPDGLAGEGGFAGVGAQGLGGHVLGEEGAGDVGGGAGMAGEGLFRRLLGQGGGVTRAGLLKRVDVNGGGVFFLLVGFLGVGAFQQAESVDFGLVGAVEMLGPLGGAVDARDLGGGFW